MKLVSDFRDYYDHWFNNNDPVFERLMISGPRKEGQFGLIECCGYKVVAHGRPKDFNSNDLLVVYLDETLHAGEGKTLMPQPIALEQYPDRLCSLYIESNSLSTRYLWIGHRCFELIYENLDKREWRSNVGEVDIRFVTELFNHPHPKMLNRHPLVAIDFVNGLAIDLNISPGLKWTGIEDILSGREVYKLISDWMTR
jgi:hypothetical protein